MRKGNSRGGERKAEVVINHLNVKPAVDSDGGHVQLISNGGINPSCCQKR